jgi:hypothetical protein
VRFALLDKIERTNKGARPKDVQWDFSARCEAANEQALPVGGLETASTKKIRVEMENIFLAGKCSVRPLKEVPCEIKK